MLASNCSWKVWNWGVFCVLINKFCNVATFRKHPKEDLDLVNYKRVFSGVSDGQGANKKQNNGS
jgi:hypothetical protein